MPFHLIFYLISISRFFLFLFFRFYLFLERAKEGERGEKHQCVAASHVHSLLGTWSTTQACALMGKPADDPLVRRMALNPLSHTSQGCFVVLSYKSLTPLVKIILSCFIFRCYFKCSCFFNFFFGLFIANGNTTELYMLIL